MRKKIGHRGVLAKGAAAGLAGTATMDLVWFARYKKAGGVLGPAAWLAGYVVLPLIKVYRPIWEYDAKTLGRDLSAHAAFGLGTAAAYRAMAPLRMRK